MKAREIYTIELSHRQVSYFEAAIRVFTEQIESGSLNYALWNNRGICKLNLGMAHHNPTLIDEAMCDFETAVANTKGVDIDEYRLSLNNLQLARKAKNVLQKIP